MHYATVRVGHHLAGASLLLEGKGLITNRRGNNRILDLEKLVRFKE